MRRGVWVTSIVLLGVLLAVLGLAGCWNPFSPGDGDGGNGPEINRKDPDKLLEFFATVYKDRDGDRYDEALDDEYTFTFRSDDYDSAGVTPAIPYWYKEEDVNRAKKMFTDVRTKEIKIDLRNLDVYWMDTVECIHLEGAGECTFVDGWQCRIRPEIDVTIELEAGKEPVTKQVRLSWLWITVIPDRAVPGLWTILKIVEVPVT